jgi:hypothetical protein
MVSIGAVAMTAATQASGKVANDNRSSSNGSSATQLAQAPPKRISHSATALQHPISNKEANPKTDTLKLSGAAGAASRNMLLRQSENFSSMERTRQFIKLATIPNSIAVNQNLSHAHQKIIAQNLPAGNRPDPRFYTTKKEYDAHVAKFKDGAGFFFWRSNVVKSDFSSFAPDKYVIPKKDFERLAAEYKRTGDHRVIEVALGLEKDILKGEKIYGMEIQNPKVRMPSGNERGTNKNWRPGGYTHPGNLPEATLVDFNMRHDNKIENLRKLDGFRDLI